VVIAGEGGGGGCPPLTAKVATTADHFVELLIENVPLYVPVPDVNSVSVAAREPSAVGS
jgi:hypothetical protein